MAMTDDVISPRDAQIKRLIKEWHDAGMAAYRAGQARNDYPFKVALRRKNLDIVWQTGWDTAALLEAINVGANADKQASCPYTDPALAAAWRQGWSAVHGLRLVASTKTPVWRAQDAKPGRS